MCGVCIYMYVHTCVSDVGVCICIPPPPPLRLAGINTAEEERELRAAGRNNLETLLLDIRDKMSQQEYDESSVQGDQETLAEKCNTVSGGGDQDGIYS